MRAFDETEKLIESEAPVEVTTGTEAIEKFTEVASKLCEALNAFVENVTTKSDVEEKESESEE